MKIPTAKELRAMPGLRWFGARLQQRTLWAFDKKPVARGVAVGFFMCWIPVPFQMFFAIPLAIVCNAHIPAALICVWFSNPLTWLPMLALAYEMGYLVLQPPKHYLIEINEAASFGEAVAAIFPEAFGTALLGAAFLQVVSAAAGYALVIWFWEWLAKVAPMSSDD